MIKNLKKVISTVAAVATLASSASALAVSFPDVDSSASYAGAVDALVALGIVNGDENGKFNPDNSVTRAEFAKMVVEALGDGDAAASSTYTKFTDAQGHWAAGYIETGVAKQFINGYDETTFGPDDTVTYAQGVKMLVGACGYSLWAENQGGWPSGYLAYGSSLDIVKGIAGTVSNDTALTRAQCAVLIYNALKAPILAVNGYDYDTAGNLVPQYEAQDGKNDRDFASMLTEYHDAYVVKGRVDATAKTDGSLDADQVKFNIELSDNFDDNKVKVTVAADGTETGSVLETVYVGSTNAVNLLLTYSEAILQRDEDTDELTLVSITPYGANKTVEVAADLIRTTEDDNKNGTDPFATEGKKQLAVAKSETTSATTKYDLDVKKLFVNGAELTWDEDNFNTYVKENTTATVTLIDATQPGSTSTDGKYDYVMVDYYATAVVDSIAVSDTNVRLYFKESSNKDLTLQYDPEDEDIHVSIVKDGAEFKVEDLVEFDVVSIVYDVNAGMDNSEYFEIYVSSNAPVTGMLKSYDEEENSLTIDGTEYKAIKANVEAAGFKDQLSGEFTLYFDAFGNVAYVDEGSSSKNYGVIVGAYDSNSYDEMVVRMVTADGEIKIIECKTSEIADQVKEIITAAGGVANATTYLQKKELEDGTANIAELVVDYKLSSGKINKIEKVDSPNATAANQEFKESSVKLGTYALNDAATKVVVLEDYLNGGSDVGAMTVANFEDEVKYDAYVYGKNKNTGVYQFVVVFGGLANVRAKSAWAMVKNNAQLTQVNDEDCYTMTVFNGLEEVEVSVSTSIGDRAPQEGDVISYSMGTKGYIESQYYYTVAKGSDVISDYSTLYDMWKDGDLAATDYVTNVIDADEDAEYYFAPVYKKANNNIEIFKSVDDDKSDVNEVESLTIDSNTNVYVYDYSKSVKYRAASGAVPNQNTGIFKPALSGSDNEILTWVSDDDEVKTVASEGISVNYALIKVVEDDVTDIVIYMAN